MIGILLFIIVIGFLLIKFGGTILRLTIHLAVGIIETIGMLGLGLLIFGIVMMMAVPVTIGFIL